MKECKVFNSTIEIGKMKFSNKMLRENHTGIHSHIAKFDPIKGSKLLRDDCKYAHHEMFDNVLTQLSKQLKKFGEDEPTKIQIDIIKLNRPLEASFWEIDYLYKQDLPLRSKKLIQPSKLMAKQYFSLPEFPIMFWCSDTLFETVNGVVIAKPVHFCKQAPDLFENKDNIEQFVIRYETPKEEDELNTIPTEPMMLERQKLYVCTQFFMRKPILPIDLPKQKFSAAPTVIIIRVPIDKYVKINNYCE